MYAMRINEAADDGYGNLILTGRSTGTCERDQPLTWARSGQTPGHAVVDYAASDRVIVRRGFSDGLAAGVILMDA